MVFALLAVLLCVSLSSTPAKLLVGCEQNNKKRYCAHEESSFVENATCSGKLDGVNQTKQWLLEEKKNFGRKCALLRSNQKLQFCEQTKRENKRSE
jgi:hypothetical protein